MLFHLPTQKDVLQILIEKDNQNDDLIDNFTDFYEKQKELIEEEQVRLIEELYRLEQERLDALDDDNDDLERTEEELLYTLEDRDKEADYDNLFDPTLSHTFIIDFTQDEWDELITNMEEYNEDYGSYKSNHYSKVDVTYITDSEEIFIQDVGIRTKGNNYSRVLPEENGVFRDVHYALKFNETFDTYEGTQAYTDLKTREVFDLEKLYFKWNKNNDQTYLSELYSNHLFREAGVYSASTNLTKFVVKIDGQIITEALYTVFEGMDEEFIRRHIQETPTKEVGDLYKVVWRGNLAPLNSSNYYYNAQEYPSYPNASIQTFGVRISELNIRPTYGKETNQLSDDYTNLLEFTQNLDQLNGDQLKTYLDENMDVDMWIRSMAIDYYLGNPDGYRTNSNNYYIYFDENDKLSFIPFDYDWSMGQHWSYNNYSLDEDIYMWGSNTYSPLVDKVLSIEEYRTLYEYYLGLFIEDKTFSNESFDQLFNTYQSIYGDEFSMNNDKTYYITQKILNVQENLDRYGN